MEEYNVDYYDNGNKCYESWYKDGKLHREDGSALISYLNNGSKEYEYWYKDGEYHREDGPAWIGYNDNGSKRYESWYLHDHGYTKSVYNDIIEFGKSIVTRDAAIMNIKHPSKFIRMRCQEILNGRA
jgi:hypothetical protein